MITVGGIASSNVTATCDWESMGVAILDLTSMGWGSVFDSQAAPYQVNTMISDVVGGGPDGNATKLLPDGGWTSTGLAKLFTGTTNQTEPYSPPGNQPATTGSGGTGSTNTGAIVGGVVGGVAFLALVGFLAWRVKKKRLSRLGGTKDANGQPRFDSLELQSTPAAETAKPAVMTYEAPGVTPANELSGHGLTELGGRGLVELDGGR